MVHTQSAAHWVGVWYTHSLLYTHWVGVVHTQSAAHWVCVWYTHSLLHIGCVCGTHTVCCTLGVCAHLVLAVVEQQGEYDHCIVAMVLSQLRD